MTAMGFTDVFISNDTFPNFLLHNNGDGTFTDVAMLAGVQYNESGKTVAGMGVDFRDIDNDGRPDIFQTAMFGGQFSALSQCGQWPVSGRIRRSPASHGSPAG